MAATSGTSSRLTQSVSDRFTPANYDGESQALKWSAASRRPEPPAWAGLPAADIAGQGLRSPTVDAIIELSYWLGPRTGFPHSRC